MLRIVQARSAAQAKSYYSHSDYYTEGQELAGVWRGKGADRLGLASLVEKHQFDALCDNRHPATGEQVTAAQRGDRTVGYDFNFHAPKSLSLLHALTDDPALLTAFQASVDETMRLIEADAQARVRKGGVEADRTTGELVWTRFDHLTARPIDGVPDPHLHSHCFVLNMTFDGHEDRWKAGQFRALKQDAPYYQAAFHAGLTARLRGLGYAIEVTRDGWEVAGFSTATLDDFSRRTKQIEAVAREAGITDADEKSALGAKTRQGKAKQLTMPELRALWTDRLAAGEQDALPVRSDTPVPAAGPDPRAALDFACRHLFERASVVAERQLAAEMLKAGLGRFSAAEALATIRDSDVIIRELNGRRLATTREVLAEEERLIAVARDGRGQCDALNGAEAAADRRGLSAGQQAAVKHVLSSPDRVMLIRGAAGAGKTTLMTEAAAAIERGGRRVYAFAPSAAASRGVLRSEGFAQADTVARLLVDTRLQQETRGQVLWIDEAGLLGSKAMRQVFDLADRNDCRVILSGDRKQHGAVERGAVLKVLETQAGLPVAEVKEIMRQRGADREAVALLADGRTEEGFDRLDALGWVKEVPTAERYHRLAADYVAAVGAGKTALVVSPTHAEGARVTAAVRAALREAGMLTGDDHALTAFTRVDLTEAQRGVVTSYRAGDVLQFHQNAKGYTTGDRLTVAQGTADSGRPGRPVPGVPPGGPKRRRRGPGADHQGRHGRRTATSWRPAPSTPSPASRKAGDLKLANGWVVGQGLRPPGPRVRGHQPRQPGPDGGPRVHRPVGGIVGGERPERAILRLRQPRPTVGDRVHRRRGRVAGGHRPHRGPAGGHRPGGIPCQHPRPPAAAAGAGPRPPPPRPGGPFGLGNGRSPVAELPTLADRLQARRTANPADDDPDLGR